MRVWIDGQCLQTASTLRGIGRYMHELIGSIARIESGIDLHISFNAALADEAIAAADVVRQSLPVGNIHVWQGIAEGGEALVGLTENRKISELAIAHHVACLQPDIALCASAFEGAGDAAVPLLPSPLLDIPIAAIFYDAIPYRYRSRYLVNEELASFYDRRFAAHAGFDALLGISEFAAREAKDLFPKVRSYAIDAGPTSSFLTVMTEIAREPHEAAVAKLPIRTPFLLYVGALDWRKNVGVVVEAFTMLPERIASKLSFVIAGAYTADAAELIVNRWNGMGLPPDGLVMLGRVSDEMLARLYREAALVVQPSIMEGFGLTALEAMICGAPVIGANTGALPEVIGDMRAQFDPTKPGEVARLIAEILENKAFSASLVDRAQIQIKKFSWDRTARLTLAALEDVLLHGTTKASKCTNAAPTLSDRRERAASLAKKHGVAPELKATLFAAAESGTPAVPKVMIDVSGMCARDHGTGIQRVARKLVQAWTTTTVEANSPAMELVSCTSAATYAKVTCDGPGDVGKFRMDEADVARFGTGGWVVLLDGSWDFHERHAKLLRRARLQHNEVITVLYDLIPVRLSGFCAPGVPAVFCAGLLAALQFSTGFVCISKAVADEFLGLLEALHFPRRMRVGYWHLGADFAPSARDSSLCPAKRVNLAQLGANGIDAAPRFLMVGTLEPRKGHRVAIAAFEQLWKKGSDAALVIVGKRGWGVDALAVTIEAHPQYGKKLHWIDDANDAELQAHYASATAIIAASYAEGFGLPIVEAAFFCKPVIASDIPVFREVGGAGVVSEYFDVGSASSLAAAVERELKGNRPAIAVPTTSGERWKSWAESAEDLKRIFDGSNWYKTYEPKEPDAYTPISAIGVTRMTGPVAESDRKFKLELVEGPVVEPHGQLLRIVVAVTNTSTVTWSSQGPMNSGMGISLSYHLLDYNGESIQYDNPRESLPLVLPPEQTAVLALSFNSDWLDRGAAYVEVELLQEMVAWWGTPLRVKLDDGTRMIMMKRTGAEAVV